jgi:cytochrome P450
MRPWFWDSPAFLRDPLTYLLDRAAPGAAPLEQLHISHRRMFLVTDPRLVKPILKTSETIVQKGFLVRKLAPIVGLSSLVLNGEEHLKRRRATHKHLARGELDRLLPQFCAEIRSLAAALMRKEAFAPHPATAALAIRFVCIAAFGKRVLNPADESVLLNAVHSTEDDLAAEIFSFWPNAPWLWHRRSRRDLAKRAMGLIVDRVRDQVAETSILRSLEAIDLDEEAIRDELLTLLLAGHHTTGTAAAWLLYHLAVQPGMLERVAEEADFATGLDGELMPSRLHDCETSAALVREVLRLYPSSWWFSREVTTSIEIGGRTLRRGDSIIVSPWAYHHDPRHWDDPEAFRTDRDYGTPAYMPFGVGPRACVGIGLAMLELQLLALEIAGAYTIENVGPTPARWPKASVTLTPPPMSLRLSPRRASDARARPALTAAE